jgi:CHAT domain-containing protein
MEGSAPGTITTPRRLDVRLIHGSITNVPSPAYVLGVFDNVNPTGTARAVDALLGGALSQLVQDRMFGSRLGEIFIMPTPRRRTLAEMIVFIGLGPLDSFRPQILELVAENLARVVTAAGMHTFTTVPIGTNAGLLVQDSIASFSTGFLRGLERADPDQDFRSIQVCELNGERYRALLSGLQAAVAGGYYHKRGVELVVREGKPVGEAPVEERKAEVATGGALDPLYLQVRARANAASSESVLEYSVLTADLDAAIERHEHTITQRQREEAGARLDSARQIDAELGRALADFYLPPKTRELMKSRLEKEPDRHVVIIHDSGSSFVPWEVLYYGDKCPAIEAGVSRKFVLDAPRAGGRSNLPSQTVLKMLVIANPTEDLNGAEKEGEMLVSLFQQNRGKVTVLRRKEATKARVLEELAKSEYDILHYAGHAEFAKDDPSKSGVVCADGVLSSADITSSVIAPQLVFLNGCESARVRGRATRSIREALYTDFVQNVSLAEMILSGGVRNFIGTYWPVGDHAALELSGSLYKDLLQGAALGTALCTARKKVQAFSGRDWANYLHFGNPHYRLRHK